MLGDPSYQLFLGFPAFVQLLKIYPVQAAKLGSAESAKFFVHQGVTQTPVRLQEPLLAFNQNPESFGWAGESPAKRLATCNADGRGHRRPCAGPHLYRENALE